MMDTFLLSCLSFLAGIALRSTVKIPTFPIYLLSLALLVFIFLVSKKSRRYCIAGLFLFLGVIWHSLFLPQINQNHIAYYNDQIIEFTGLVSEEPNKQENNTQYILSVKELKNIAETNRHAVSINKNDTVETTRRVVSTQVVSTIKGWVLITTRLYPEYKYGDLLQISCLLKRPEPIEDFHYDQYLAAKNIYSVCSYPSIVKIGVNQGNFVKAKILNFKKKFLDILNQIYPEPSAALLSGLLLGGKRSITGDLKEAFIKSGVIHIVAISGYNISIIIKVLSGILPFFYISRKKSFPFLILGIFFFVILTGAESSVMRAGIMGIIASLANFSGRLSNTGRVLIVAALIMVLINPQILIFDLGFQLSFLATIGLIYLNPLFSSKLSKCLKLMKNVTYNSSKFKILPRQQLARSSSGAGQSSKLQLKTQSLTLSYIFNIWQGVVAKVPPAVQKTISESFTNTLAATIMTLPLILYRFGRLSLISVLANVLILWCLPLVMLLGFLNVMIVFLLTPFFSGSIALGRWLAWPVWLLLSYIIGVVFYLSNLPLAQMSVSWFSLPWLIICYVVIFWIIVWLKRVRISVQYR